VCWQRHEIRKMEVENAIVTLLTESGLFCSAFDGVIVFGEIERRAYPSNKYFLFYKREYYLFFVFIFQIAKVVSGQSTNTQSTILEKDNRKYSWTILQHANEDECKILLQSETGTVVYKTQFNLSEMKHFALTITRLIVPSLNLTFAQSEMMEIASDSTVKTIESFKNLTHRKDFIRKVFKSTDQSIESYSVLLLHYRDIIMLLHKLKSIASSDEDELNKILIV